jgi:hypothetical protein
VLDCLHGILIVKASLVSGFFRKFLGYLGILGIKKNTDSIFDNILSLPIPPSTCKDMV